MKIELSRSEQAMESKVSVNEYTDLVKNCFDFEFDGTISYRPYVVPKELPTDFGTLLIVGGSGTGKSQLLKQFGTEDIIEWNNDSVITNFSSPKEAVDKLGSVGFNSIPQWVKPYKCLSNGEQFRCDLAMKLHDNSVIDEFTSVVDRNVAKSCCVSISKYIKNNNLKNIVFASCHKDIIEYLQPDYVIDTDLGLLYSKEYLRRPRFNIRIEKTNWKSWKHFSKYHYLTSSLNKACRAYLIFWDDVCIGFTSYIASPNGYIKNAWREHRTVILPEYQGLGIGCKISELIGEDILKSGGRYYSKTAHIRLGEHRNNSNLWKPATHNQQRRIKSYKHNEGEYDSLDTTRICYSHEYVGKDYNTKEQLHVICYSDNVDKLKEICYINYNKFITVYSDKDSLCDKLCIELQLRRDFVPKKTKLKKMKNENIITI